MTYEELVEKWEEFRKLEQQLNEGFNNSKVQQWKYIPNDLVIDEEKSVKWNREEVIRRREAYKTAKKNRDDALSNGLKEVENSIKEYIQENYEVSDKQYSKMLNFLYEHDEDTDNYTNGFSSKVGYLENLAELITTK